MFEAERLAQIASRLEEITIALQGLREPLQELAASLALLTKIVHNRMPQP